MAGNENGVAPICGQIAGGQMSPKTPYSVGTFMDKVNSLASNPKLKPSVWSNGSREIIQYKDADGRVAAAIYRSPIIGTDVVTYNIADTTNYTPAESIPAERCTDFDNTSRFNYCIQNSFNGTQLVKDEAGVTVETYNRLY